MLRKDADAILDLSPLLQQPQVDYGSRDLYLERLQGSSGYIQSALDRLENFTRNKKIKKSTLFGIATLTLMGLYVVFIYVSVRFFRLDEPSLLKYLNTPINNNTATCGDLYPMKGNVCKYLNTKNIPKQSPFVFYCLEWLGYLYGSSRHTAVTDFMNRNCFQYFPEINLGNVYSLYAPLLECIGYISYFGGGTKLDYSQYLNATVVKEGVSVLCTSLLAFANSTMYEAFKQGNLDICHIDIFEIDYRYSEPYRNYNLPIGHLGSCNATYPAPLMPKDGTQYVYNVSQGSGTCFGVAKAQCDKTCWSREWGEDVWTTPLRAGLIATGVFTLIGLIALTITLGYLLYKTVKRSYVFQDLEQNQQQQINDIVKNLGTNAGVSLQDKELVEVKREITKIQDNESKDLRVAKSFLDPAPGTPLSLFFQKDASYEATNIILSKVISGKKPSL